MAWEGAEGYLTQAEGAVGSQRFLSHERIGGRRPTLCQLLLPVGRGSTPVECSGSTGTVKRNQTLSPRTIEYFNIPLPPIAEQLRRVARTLTCIEEIAGAIANRRASSTPLVTAFIDSYVGGQWPMARIGDLVTRVSRPEKVRQETSYSLLGVRWYGSGVFLRERRLGASLAAKTLYRVVEGDFIDNLLVRLEASPVCCCGCRTCTLLRIQ